MEEQTRGTPLADFRVIHASDRSIAVRVVYARVRPRVASRWKCVPAFTKRQFQSEAARFRSVINSLARRVSLVNPAGSFHARRVLLTSVVNVDLHNGTATCPGNN